MKRRQLLTFFISSPLLLLYSKNSQAWFWIALRGLRAIYNIIKLTKTVSRINKQKTIFSGISMLSSTTVRATQKVSKSNAKRKIDQALKKEKNITKKDREKLVTRIVDIAGNIQDFKDLSEHLNTQWNSSSPKSVKANREHVVSCTRCKPIYDELTRDTDLVFSNSNTMNYQIYPKRECEDYPEDCGYGRRENRFWNEY